MLQVSPRPLGFGELLDGAFTLLRRHFVLLFSLALIPQVPEILYWLGVTALVPLELQTFAGLFIVPWTWAITVLLTGALVHSVVHLLHGDAEPTIRDSLVAGLQNWIPLAVAFILVVVALSTLFGGGALAVGISAATGVLVLGPFGIFLAALAGAALLAVMAFLFASFFAFAPAVVVEDAGPIRSLVRSWELASGDRIRILAITLIAWILVLIPSVIATVFSISVMGFEAFFSGDPEAMQDSSLWATAVLQIVGPILNAITYPFLMAVVTLLYLDRRARTEAPDLARAVDSLATGAPGADPATPGA
ncbi:MAG: hypothetical protein EA352_01915 [Gemmatimonadales bacterium]|nr:MAG: hypothetical protein EA352_01915 [Gemmatimonadales bacterium]